MEEKCDLQLFEDSTSVYRCLRNTFGIPVCANVWTIGHLGSAQEKRKRQRMFWYEAQLFTGIVFGAVKLRVGKYEASSSPERFEQLVEYHDWHARAGG